MPRGLQQILILTLLGLFVSPAITFSQEEPVELQGLVEQVLASEMYRDHGETETVTMSPDRDLVKGFKSLGEPGLVKLREFLNHESRDVRHHACLILTDVPQGNDILLEAIKDETCQSREGILRMIGGPIRDHRFIAAAGELIHDQDKSLSLAAIGIAGRTHYLNVANDLVQMTKDDQERAVAAAYALCNMNVPLGAATVVKNARKTVEIPFEQGKVIDTLGASGSVDAVDYLLELFVKGAEMTALHALSAGDPTAGKSLLSYLETAPPEASSYILFIISKTEDKSLVPKLRELAEQAGDDRKPPVVAALASLGDDSILDDAIELMNSTDESKREFGIISIARLAGSNERALDAATKFIAQPDTRSAENMIHWLGTHANHPNVEAVLLEQFKSVVEPTSGMLRAVATAGGPKTIAWLKEQTQSKSSKVRYVSACCLGAMTGQQQIYVRDSGEEVVVVLTSVDDQIRRKRLKPASKTE